MFQHPDPLQQLSTSASARLTTIDQELVVAGVAGKRIRVKSWAFNTFGPGTTNWHIIDKLDASEVLIREDLAIDAGLIEQESDDDGIAVLRAGASLVFRLKAGLVSHVRVNYWIA